MATSEEYLKEHNIKSVMLMTADVSAPKLVISIDNQDLSIDINQNMIHDMKNGNFQTIEEVMENTVYEYEWKKKAKERKPKLDKILRKSRE